MTKSKYSKMMGKVGEDNLFELLESIPGNKRIIRNLYVPIKNGTTEIDGIMIHETGIYIFECKNYSGYVKGNIEDNTWTCTYNNGNTYSLYNPTKQNELHSNVIYKILKEHFSYVKTFSYVVFNNNCELDIDGISRFHRVITLNDLSTLLYLDSQYSTTRYSMNQINAIYNCLSKFTATDKKTVKNHKRQIQKKYGRNKKYSSNKKHTLTKVAAAIIAIACLLGQIDSIKWIRNVSPEAQYVRTSVILDGNTLFSITTPSILYLFEIANKYKMPCFY